MGTVTVASLVADKTAAQAQHASTVLGACEYVESAWSRAVSDRDLDPEDIEASAAAEVAAALSVPGSVVSEWRYLGASARPTVRRAFADPDHERVVRERATAERTVLVRRRPRGQAELVMRGPQADVAAAHRAVTDSVRSLCPADPRPSGARAFDAAVGALTGERLTCRCEDAGCPNRAGVATPRAIAHIVIDAATAAGLAGEPGHLIGWEPVPADVARRLAADATWRAIIDDARTPNGRQARRTRTHPPGWVPDNGELRSATAVEVHARLDELRMPAARFPDDPIRLRGPDPAGHGGHESAPRGALTYRPSAAVAAVVTACYSTCVHPGCAVPSGDCDLDHVVPFDHRDPVNGGWTVDGNLRPLCRHHHGLKTRGQWEYRVLDLGIVHIRDPNGRHHFTAPDGVQT